MTHRGCNLMHLSECGHWSCDDRHTLRSYHAHDNAEARSLARFVASHCSVELEGSIGNLFSRFAPVKSVRFHMFFFHIASLVLFHCWWFLPNNGLICANIDPRKKEPWIGVVQCFWPINRSGFSMREWILHKMTKMLATSNFPHPNDWQIFDYLSMATSQNIRVLMTPNGRLLVHLPHPKIMFHGFHHAGATQREVQPDENVFSQLRSWMVCFFF